MICIEEKLIYLKNSCTCKEQICYACHKSMIEKFKQKPNLQKCPTCRCRTEKNPQKIKIELCLTRRLIFFEKKHQIKYENHEITMEDLDDIRKICIKNEYLFDSCKLEDAEFTQFYLELNIDPNSRTRDYTKNTPLHVASAQNRLNVVKLLLDYKADVNALCNNNTKGHQVALTSLCVAITNKSNEVANFLCKQNGVDFRLALHFATAKDNIEIVKFLLDEKNVDINLKETVERVTIAHCAASYGFENLLNEIIYRRAKLELKNRYGHTPIESAYDRKKYNTMEILLKANVNSNILMERVIADSDIFALNMMLEYVDTIEQKYITQAQLVYKLNRENADCKKVFETLLLLKNKKQI